MLRALFQDVHVQVSAGFLSFTKELTTDTEGVMPDKYCIFRTLGST